jgi:hypothetical protein
LKNEQPTAPASTPQMMAARLKRLKNVSKGIIMPFLPTTPCHAM